MKRQRENPNDRSSFTRGRRKSNELTDLETEIMQVVWKRPTATAAEVREALLPDRPLALTTVITVLERLRRKKMVHAVPTIERSRRYRAGIPKETIANNLLANLMRRFFNNSPASLVAHIVRHESIDESELNEIRDLFEEALEEEEDQ